MKSQKNILVVISNIFYLSPLLFIPESASSVEEFLIALASVGLMMCSGIFHWHEYKWNGSIHHPNGGFTESWKSSIGYFWQKADMFAIYVFFSTTLGFLVGATFFGFLIGLLIGIFYIKSFFDHYTIGLLVLFNIVAVSGINLELALGILFIYGLAYIIRTEADVDPIRHSWWHVLTGVSNGLLIAATTLAINLL